MKTHKKIILLSLGTAVFIAAAAFTSCKKNETSTPSTQKEKQINITHPSSIEDMNAYLKGFLANMQNAKQGEALSIAEAEWHLTNLENYEYANANVEYNDIRFDTLYSTVLISSGEISLSELNAAYSDIKNKICALYNSLDLNNRNFRYISSTISKDGEIVVSTIMTYNNSSKWYYFSNDSFCDLYFDDNTNYPANGFGMSELVRAFNLAVGKPTDPSADRIYYTTTRYMDFHYSEFLDGNSPNGYSRLFYTTGYYTSPIPKEDMCYYLDSYIGLGKQYENSHAGNCIVTAGLEFEQGLHGNRQQLEQCPGGHILRVLYGLAVANNNQPSF